VNAKFQYSLENFRGVAIIFVMLSHLGSFEGATGVGKFFYFVVANATAWFVFLSGYLFYHIERNRFVYAGYLSKKARYVVLPYLILSIFPLVAGFLFGRPALLGLSGPGYVGWSLVVGGSVVGPLWFVPMITIFFLCSPVFNRLARTRMIYPLALAGIAFSVFSWRPIVNANPLLAFLNFLGFYLLGLAFAAGRGYLDALRESVKSALILACLGLFVAAFALYVALTDSPAGFFDGLGIFNPLQFGKLALLVALFFLFERYLNKQNEMLAMTAKISFGLFFMHGFYLMAFARIQPFLPGGNGLLTFFEEVAIVILASFVTVLSIQRILGKHSRYVIGC